MWFLDKNCVLKFSQRTERYVGSWRTLRVEVQCPEDETRDISEIPFFAREPNYEITSQPTNKTVIEISKHRLIPGFFC
jgi:hypothetical protein